MPAHPLASPEWSTRASFAEDVRQGLTGRPKTLPPYWFYDELGFQLFEAICRLPWYGIPRAEERLLARHGVAVARWLGGPARLVELGGGSGRKLRVLLDAFGPTDRPMAVHLIDLSPVALAAAQAALGPAGGLAVVTHRASYQAGLRAALGAPASGRTLVLFLGSNLGNFDPAPAATFLADLRAALAPGDGVLLGVDLVKPAAQLVAAYDDPLGVTAAFNKNLLVRMNRELGATFDPAAFDHRAVWNPAHGRVEMHLVSRVAHQVDIPGAGCVVEFAAGESIWTESAYKYELAGLDALVRRAGFNPAARWVDEETQFALVLVTRP